MKQTASVCQDVDDPQVPQPTKNFPKPMNLWVVLLLMPYAV